MNSELARTFYVGAAPASWDALSSFFVEKKAPLPLAVELGLIKPSQKGGRPGGPGYFDLFRNRAIFPILDLRGKVAGFGGRGLPLPEGSMDVGGESPKYLNSNESLVFQKGKLAYGLYQAQKHVREKDEVILVEGYFDVLALHAAGFQNVVATCGTALTPDHLSLFKKFCTKVTVLFDGDKAGISATDRAMELGLQHGSILYGAAMPPNLDPDELLFDQQTGVPKVDGVAKMQEILNAATPLLDSRIAAAAVHSRAGPEAMTQALKQVATWLGQYRDPVGKEVRVKAVLDQFGVSRQLLDQAISSTAGKTRPAASAGPVAGIGNPNKIQIQVSPAGVPIKRPPRPKPLSQREIVLLTGLARGGRFSQILAEARASLPPNQGIYDLFENEAAREFTRKLLTEPGAVDRFRALPEAFLREIENAELRSVLTEALIEGEASFEETEVKRARDQSIARNWARFSQQIKTALADAETKKDAQLHAQLMKEYLDVQRKMKEFISFYDEA